MLDELIECCSSEEFNADRKGAEQMKEVVKGSADLRMAMTELIELGENAMQRVEQDIDARKTTCAIQKLGELKASPLADVKA